MLANTWGWPSDGIPVQIAYHRTVIVEGAGHFVQSDTPELFSTAVREWFTDHRHDAPQ